MRRTATALIIVGITQGTMAAIINIPANYPTIQQGIDASIDRDTVLVQPGSYHENLNFNGHNIVLGSLFLTTGDEGFVATTIIDGDSSGAAITLSNFESSSALITGFTVTDGGGVQGGGIICDQSGPTISHNLIVENYGESGGGIYCIGADPVINDNRFMANITGGIGCFRSRPKITGNLFMGNIAELGGAIYLENSPEAIIVGNNITRNFGLLDGAGIYCNTSDAVITGNQITENIAGRGAGIFCLSSSPTLTGNTISHNQAEINGGGFYLDHSDPVMGNNIVAGNLANYLGAGLFCNHSNPLIINCTVTGNWAVSRGGGIYNFYALPEIVNSIIWANDAPAGPQIYNYSGPFEITYSDIQGGWPGTGNIDIDPLFRNPAGGDFHLMSTACGDPYDSPCIDAGDPLIADSLLECSWGLGTSVCDMGAYGGGDSATVGIFEDSSPLPERYPMIGNYPNPFNQNTTIKFDLPFYCYTAIDIFDVLGREVENLLSEIKPPGSYSIKWEANDRASGIYFYRLEACDYTRIGKMVLLR